MILTVRMSASFIWLFVAGQALSYTGHERPHVRLGPDRLYTYSTSRALVGTDAHLFVLFYWILTPILYYTNVRRPPSSFLPAHLTITDLETRPIPHLRQRAI